MEHLDRGSAEAINMNRKANALRPFQLLQARWEHGRAAGPFYTHEPREGTQSLFDYGQLQFTVRPTVSVHWAVLFWTQVEPDRQGTAPATIMLIFHFNERLRLQSLPHKCPSLSVMVARTELRIPACYSSASLSRKPAKARWPLFDRSLSESPRRRVVSTDRTSGIA